MYQLREKILPIVLTSMVEAENFSDHPRKAPFICEFIADKSNVNPYKAASMIVSVNKMPPQNTGAAIFLIRNETKFQRYGAF